MEQPQDRAGEQRSDAAEARASGRDRRGVFERFVESVNARVSRPPTFFLILAGIVAWGLSYPLWGKHDDWQYVIHTVSSVLSLLLLVLLENANRRTEEAAQEKLNVIAEALSALMTHHASDNEELREAVQKLRDAVGLEGRY